MRTSIAGVVAALSIGVAALPVPVVSAHRARVAVVAKTCKRGTPARIGGKTKCLQPGEYCAKRYQHQYERNGFKCVGGRLRYN